jgi:hypothetical protein
MPDKPGEHSLGLFAGIGSEERASRWGVEFGIGKGEGVGEGSGDGVGEGGLVGWGQGGERGERRVARQLLDRDRGRCHRTFGLCTKFSSIMIKSSLAIVVQHVLLQVQAHVIFVSSDSHSGVLTRMPLLPIATRR